MAKSNEIECDTVRIVCFWHNKVPVANCKSIARPIVNLSPFYMNANIKGGNSKGFGKMNADAFTSLNPRKN